jgi:DNA (cytosine-5)-methyltransferase 1
MMNKPKLLDLFCGAGGAAQGYADAGFEVTGVDNKPQKHYPFTFIQADVLTFPLDGFDVIHASPPCQGYSRSRHIRMNRTDRIEHPLLIDQMRARLIQSGLPWVIENVSEAPMSHFLTLCGTQFGLPIYRHRQFETSHLVLSPGRCHHPHKLLPGYVCVYGDHVRGTQIGRYGNNYQRYPVEAGRSAMGIDWMTQKELSQAVPPAYTRWIGRFLIDAIQESRAAS